MKRFWRILGVALVGATLLAFDVGLAIVYTAPTAAWSAPDEPDDSENQRNRKGGRGRPRKPNQPGNSTPPGGWGKDGTQWIAYSDAWTTDEVCYDPVAEGWVNCSNEESSTWPAFSVEMWIEMECVFHWDTRHVKIHRASDYSDIVIELSGGSCCNTIQCLITTPPVSRSNLEVLPFQEDMFGRTGPQYGTDIPLTWEYSINGGPFAPLLDITNTPGPGSTSKYFAVPLSCNDWVIRLTGDLNFHQEDGYYFLGGPGAITYSVIHM